MSRSFSAKLRFVFEILRVQKNHSVFLAASLLKRSKNQRQKYRTTFFYYIEDHMQKFKPFREIFFSTQIVT